MLTEKQRVALPIPLWLSLLGIIITGAGAWFATQAKASAADEAVRAHAVQISDHDRRITRVEDAQQWQREMLERIDKKLDRLRKDER